MRHSDVVIVGMGHGGAQAASALRQRGYGGSILMVGEEPELPYERPPLSKEYLAGERPFERLLIRSPAFWAERSIEALTNILVTAIKPNERILVCADGQSIGYGELIWAAGGHPRKLTCDGAHLSGLHSIRSRDDVDRIAFELDSVDRIVVIGAGYIGLEAAAVLIKMGKQVTVIEAQDRVLARVAGEPLSRFYEKEHRAHGVEFRLGETVERVEGDQGRVTGIRTAGGAIVPADMVIVGIGIAPSIEALQAAGASVGDGVAVDENGRTSLPHIWAIGDCALHVNAFANNAEIRLESVQNASDMATGVAKAIAGAPEPYRSVPWFWSNQYNLRLQTVGLSLGHDEAIVRGNPDTRAFSVIYLKNGRVIALDCVNSARDYVQGKALVMGRVSADRVRLADASRPLKEL